MTFVVPDRMPAVELGATNSAQFMRRSTRLGVPFVPDLDAPGRARARATGSWPPSATCTPSACEERRADHVVVEHGTVPADELYHELKAGSRNQGEIDQAALVAGRPQPAFDANPAGRYLLFGWATRWRAATSMRRSTIHCVC